MRFRVLGGRANHLKLPSGSFQTGFSRCGQAPEFDLRMPMKEASQSEPVNNRTAIDCVQRRCRVQEWSGHERTWRWGFQKFGDVGPQWRGWGPDVWPERCGSCPKISSCIWGLLLEFAYHSKSKGVGLQMAVVSKGNLAVADSYMRETLLGGRNK